MTKRMKSYIAKKIMALRRHIRELEEQVAAEMELRLPVRYGFSGMAGLDAPARSGKSGDEAPKAERGSKSRAARPQRIAKRMSAG